MHIKTTPKEKCLPGSNKVATLLSLLNPSNYILSSSTLQSQKKKQTEEKAKVVAAVCGTLNAALSSLAMYGCSKDDWKKSFWKNIFFWEGGGLMKGWALRSFPF